MNITPYWLMVAARKSARGRVVAAVAQPITEPPHEWTVRPVLDKHGWQSWWWVCAKCGERVHPYLDGSPTGGRPGPGECGGRT